MKEVTANFNEYSEYANIMGLESACKMRWAGNWPQTADENQDITNRNVPNDAQLHQQLQEQRV